MATATDLRHYEARAESTDVFGRVLCSIRQHHVVIDGPVQNGCPGEEVTPAEAFLAGVAACGVELIQVIARQQGVPLGSARVSIAAMQDRGRPVRQDISLFNAVQLDIHLAGVTQEQGNQLIDTFKRR
jgi:uncharacterized OsmC-like protein